MAAVVDLHFCKSLGAWAAAAMALWRRRRWRQRRMSTLAVKSCKLVPPPRLLLPSPTKANDLRIDCCCFLRPQIISSLRCHRSWPSFALLLRCIYQIICQISDYELDLTSFTYIRVFFHRFKVGELLTTTSAILQSYIELIDLYDLEKAKLKKMLTKMVSRK